jgi:hypothetical protein
MLTDALTSILWLPAPQPRHHDSNTSPDVARCHEQMGLKQIPGQSLTTPHADRGEKGGSKAGWVHSGRAPQVLELVTRANEERDQELSNPSPLRVKESQLWLPTVGTGGS